MADPLGEGTYSSVYKVKRPADSQEYALKKVRLLNLTDKEKENALNEVRILASIKNPNIISYKEAFADEPSSCLWYFFDSDNG
jgi:NIMA (never in mitosis gene a)-related kinase